MYVLYLYVLETFLHIHTYIYIHIYLPYLLYQSYPYSVVILADKRFNRQDKRAKFPPWITSFIREKTHTDLSADMAVEQVCICICMYKYAYISCMYM